MKDESGTAGDWSMVIRHLAIGAAWSLCPLAGTVRGGPIAGRGEERRSSPFVLLREWLYHWGSETFVQPAVFTFCGAGVGLTCRVRVVLPEMSGFHVPSTAVPISSPYLRDPDVQLMMRARDGDDEAFSELVTRYQDRLVGLLTNMVGNAENAEDLAQDVFLRVYKARNGYEPNAKFSTWLFAIAHNVACNSKRSKVRRKEVQMQPAESGVQATAMPEDAVPEKSGLMPTRLFAKKELQDRVQAAMGNLNERQRMAVLLHKFEGMSYADIGSALEMTPQAVKSLLSRARDNLREQLETYVR